MNQQIKRLEAEVASFRMKMSQPQAQENNGEVSENVDKVKTMNQLNLEPGTGVIIEIGLRDVMITPLGPKSFVLGVEASMDSVVDFLLPKYRETPNTAIICAAVFDTDGLSVFQQMDKWTAANTLVVDAGLSKYKEDFKITSQSPVATIKLDHLIDAIPDHSRLDLLKVDVQGVNFNVLKSAGVKLLRARAIFSECTRNSTKPTGETGVDLYGNVEDLCENHRSYLEKLGFVYLGHFIENEEDASGDQAFAHPDFLERAKPCVKTLGGVMGKADTGEREDLGHIESCLGVVMMDE